MFIQNEFRLRGETTSSGTLESYNRKITKSEQMKQTRHSCGCTTAGFSETMDIIRLNL